VRKLFQHAQQKVFAIPAINVTSSSTVVAALEAARDAKSPIILQVSQGGAAYFAGKGLSNDGQKASIVGAIAAAEYIRAIAPAYGIPVVLHSVSHSAARNDETNRLSRTIAQKNFFPGSMGCSTPMRPTLSNTKSLSSPPI